MSQNRICHLEMILKIAEEKAKNSNNLKRWCVSLSSAFLALSTQQQGVHVAYVALFPIFFLWLLDCHERLMFSLAFRLYDQVRLLPDELVDFSLNLERVQDASDTMIAQMLKPQLATFYGAMAAGIFIVDWLIN